MPNCAKQGQFKLRYEIKERQPKVNTTYEEEGEKGRLL